MLAVLGSAQARLARGGGGPLGSEGRVCPPPSPLRSRRLIPGDSPFRTELVETGFASPGVGKRENDRFGDLAAVPSQPHGLACVAFAKQDPRSGPDTCRVSEGVGPVGASLTLVPRWTTGVCRQPGVPGLPRRTSPHLARVAQDLRFGTPDTRREHGELGERHRARRDRCVQGRTQRKGVG